MLRRLFEPLAYEVTALRHPLDTKFSEWGESSYFTVSLKATVRLSDLLTHLYVLIPVLDDDKHYWVGDAEVEKLLRHGEGWLRAHPERELITNRYLKHQKRLAREALTRLIGEEEPEAEKPPLYSWTAISRPPYFTALALWPKGDCWNGGGWFVDDKRICLNHHRAEAQLHPDFGMGPVRPVKYAELRGEDDTVWGHVLERDGWRRIAEGKASRRGSHGWNLNPPQQWRKHDPKVRKLMLEMAITGLGGKNVPWYQTNYCIYAESDVALDLGSADWADWDHRGDLVFAKDGCLFRQNFRNLRPNSAVQIADFNGRKFEEIKPTFRAQHW